MPWFMVPWLVRFVSPWLLLLVECPGDSLIAGAPWSLASIGVTVLASLATIHIVTQGVGGLAQGGAGVVGGGAVVGGGRALCQEGRTANKEKTHLERKNNQSDKQGSDQDN